MKYVVDSSVAVKWVIPEIDSDKALRLRDDYRNAIVELIAPDVFPTELAHALTRAERQGRIAAPDAAIFWHDVMTAAPIIEPSLTLTPRAIELSSQLRIGVYDCLYLALAERDGCELVTADDKLIKNHAQQFPFIVALSALS